MTYYISFNKQSDCSLYKQHTFSEQASLISFLELSALCLSVLQSDIPMNRLEIVPVYTSCVSSLWFVLEGASCASTCSSKLELCWVKRKSRCPYVHSNVHTLIYTHTNKNSMACNTTWCTDTHTHWKTGFLCNDRHSSPTADCRSDNLPFHITPHRWVRHKHDIAPNHTDG